MPATITDQRTLWPGYVWPGAPPGPIAQEWRDFGDFAPTGQDRAGSLAVMNPASGPGTAVVDGWTAVINCARNHGHRVLGYVDTNYAGRPLGDVTADIASYYSWYGVDGVFLDRFYNGTDAAERSYCQSVYAVAKAKAASVLVVGNPGAADPSDWQLKPATKAADVLCVFEGTQATYASWTPPAWTGSYPASSFAHLVYAVTDLPGAIARSRTLRAGYRYFTPDDSPNPWDTLGHWPAQATP
jgi:hypothetical protein